MNRRGFLGLLGMAAGGVLLDQAVPFNRVWSFPKEIAFPSKSIFIPMSRADLLLSIDDFSERYLVPAIKAYMDEQERLFAYNPNFHATK